MVVVPSIEFDNQLCLRAEKVNGAWADGLL
jgi:hypothetical protein